MTVTEYCPNCDSEIEMRWNVETDGYKAFCPVCGKRLMLCDECHHRTGEYVDDCDYCSATDECRFNRDRVALIEKKKIDLDLAAEQKRKATENERQRLVCQILSLGDRIGELLRVGIALNANGFLQKNHSWAKDERLKSYGYNYEMVSEGFYHHVGFSPVGNRLKILMGGACGNYDFETDGMTVSSRNPRNGATQPVPIDHLKQFLKEFPVFEQAVYKWIDGGMKA